jgi:hypothetical protein
MPEEQQQQQSGSKSSSSGNEGDKDFKPFTVQSQEQLNGMFADRADRARREALKGIPEGDTLKGVLEKARKYQDAENEKKDAVTKEREAREAAERRIQAYEQREERNRLAEEVASKLKFGDTSIPAELLQGDTREELQNSGAKLLAFLETVSAPRAPRHNPDQGGGRGGGENANGADPIRDWLSTGQFS